MADAPALKNVTVRAIHDGVDVVETGVAYRLFRRVDVNDPDQDVELGTLERSARQANGELDFGPLQFQAGKPVHLFLRAIGQFESKDGPLYPAHIIAAPTGGVIQTFIIGTP